MSGERWKVQSDRHGLVWRKARASQGGGACVEVAPLADGVAVRDSKDRDGPVLSFTAAEWVAFLDGARNGEFDLLPRASSS